MGHQVSKIIAGTADTSTVGRILWVRVPRFGYFSIAIPFSCLMGTSSSFSARLVLYPSPRQLLATTLSSGKGFQNDLLSSAGHPCPHQPLCISCGSPENGALGAVWVTGFDISGRRVTQPLPHPHRPVSQPLSGVLDVTAALMWTHI